MDVPVVLHVCGKTSHIIEQMCATGVQGISVDSEVDLPSIISRVPSDVAIIGNLDPVGTLLLGTSAKVLEESRRCILDAGQAGGFVLAPGCGVPPNSPPENLEAMRDAAERYGRYPLIDENAGRGEI